MHISNEDLYRRAGCKSPAFQVRERILKFVNRTMNGPEQCAQALLKWKHGFKKNSASKRKISYRDQLLRLIGHQEAYPPAKKRAKIDELLSVISNPFNLAVLINTPSQTIADFQDLTPMELAT